MYSPATVPIAFALLSTTLQAVVTALTVPSLRVPACPQRGTIQYDKSVPNKTTFALTQVDLCYDDSSIAIAFTAYNETSFYVNSSQTTNDAIYEYEVMEAFIYQGTQDPQTYLEFEVNPINVTYQAFVYNPSKVRAAVSFCCSPQRLLRAYLPVVGLSSLIDFAGLGIRARRSITSSLPILWLTA